MRTKERAEPERLFAVVNEVVYRIETDIAIIVDVFHFHI